MLKRLLPMTTALALVTLPAVGSARVHHDYNGPLTYTYSLTVNSDCSLGQSPGGNFAFPAISGLGSSGESDGVGNTATTQCESSSTPTLTVSDTGENGGTNYFLTSGANTIDYQIQNSPGCCGPFYYTNSNTSGVTLNKVGVVQNWALWGWLPAQGANTPGSYSDTITLAIINY